MLILGKFRQSWYYKLYFLKLHMRVYLRTKFQVSSITLTSFRGVNSPPPQNGPLKSAPILGFKGKSRQKFSQK